MANLQIKGVDDAIYEELKKLAAAENRSVSQQTLFLIKDYLAKKQRVHTLRTPVQVLLELAGSWEGEETAEEIIAKIKKARRSIDQVKVFESLSLSVSAVLRAYCLLLTGSLLAPEFCILYSVFTWRLLPCTSFFDNDRLVIILSRDHLIPEFLFFFLPLGAEGGGEEPSQLAEEPAPAVPIFQDEDVLEKRNDVGHLFLREIGSRTHLNGLLQSFD